MTIFNTPIFSRILQALTVLIMGLTGWRVAWKLPDLPKFVLIGAPHTSNWDFVLFLGVIFKLGANVRYMGKAELFRGPLGFFFRYCGGIPVDRSRANGLVEQMVQASQAAERFILTIAPEGTRRRVGEWKRGFYHIAREAGIPIVLAVVDGKQKTVRVGQVFHPTGAVEADMAAIQSFYAGMLGVKRQDKYITIQP
jgi:1-acyl-sn-glycerol-3-phosphate acyltransferase